MPNIISEESKNSLFKVKSNLEFMLKCIDKVLYENESLTECAKRLNITPQELNKQIKTEFSTLIKNRFENTENIGTLLKGIEPCSSKLLRDVYDLSSPFEELPEYDEDKLYDIILPQVLTEREYRIICYYYGTPDNEKTYTQKEIGEMFNVSAERIRVNIVHSLRKLRRMSIAKQIFDLPTEHSLENRLKEQVNQEYEKILQDYTEMKSLEEKTKSMKESLNLKTEEHIIPITNLNMSISAYNRLKRANILSLNELARMSNTDISKIRNLGRRGYEEIMQLLIKYGFRNPDGSYNYPEPDKNSYERYDDWNDIER